MNYNFTREIKPHLTREQRLPKSYKDAEKVLQTVKSCQANLKTALYNSNLRRNAYNTVYALTFNVLKRSHLLNEITTRIKLFEKEPGLRKELAIIIIHELIFGKGLPGKSKPVEIIRKYESEIVQINNTLSTDEKFQNSRLISIPKYVRINTLVTNLSIVLEDLEYAGVNQIFYEDSINDTEYFKLVKNLNVCEFLIDKHFKDLLVFHNEENLTAWSLYQKGHVLIQDKSSYIPAYVLAPEPGSCVIDACAAPGMKTLHLTAIMENKGTIYAFERNKNRSEILKEILQSGHAEICQTFCEDFNAVDPYDAKYSSVEYILLDPSCSGSGMVSRMDFATDTETSKDEQRIQKLAGFQIILLKHVLKFPSVKRVVYSTCSITEMENEYVVQEVLSHYDHKFKLSCVLPDWPIRGSDKFEFGHLCLRADSERCLSNGFFVALFERKEETGYSQNFSSYQKNKYEGEYSGNKCGKMKHNKFKKGKKNNVILNPNEESVFETNNSKLKRKYDSMNCTKNSVYQDKTDNYASNFENKDSSLLKCKHRNKYKNDNNNDAGQCDFENQNYELEEREHKKIYGKNSNHNFAQKEILVKYQSKKINHKDYKNESEFQTKNEVQLNFIGQDNFSEKELLSKKKHKSKHNSDSKKRETELYKNNESDNNEESTPVDHKRKHKNKQNEFNKIEFNQEIEKSKNGQKSENKGLSDEELYHQETKDNISTKDNESFNNDLTHIQTKKHKKKHKNESYNNDKFNGQESENYIEENNESQTKKHKKKHNRKNKNFNIEELNSQETEISKADNKEFLHNEEPAHLHAKKYKKKHTYKSYDNVELNN